MRQIFTCYHTPIALFAESKPARVKPIPSRHECVPQVTQAAAALLTTLLGAFRLPGGARNISKQQSVEPRPPAEGWEGSSSRQRSDVRSLLVWSDASRVDMAVMPRAYAGVVRSALGVSRQRLPLLLRPTR